MSRVAKKEFRLVMYVNPTESSGFWGGRAAASPLAYYYATKKHSNVVLGGKIFLKGFGKYHQYIKDFFDKNEIFNLPKEIDCDGEKIVLSNYGYFYQSNDPLFRRFTENGIYWRYTINRIGKRNLFDEEEYSNFLLPSTKIGSENEKYDPDNSEWNAIISELKLLKNPINSQGSNQTTFKIYNGKNKEINFFRNGKPYIPRNNVFAHLNKKDMWRELDNKLNFESEDVLKPINVIDSNIKNSRIKESLVHEAIKVLVAEKGWFINSEKKVGDGRVDFIIKKSEKDSFLIIEVKLFDNPDAVEQLEDYIDAITSNLDENQKNTELFWFWNNEKNRMNKLEGIILCAYPPTKTIKECRGKKLKIWTYKFSKVGKSNECLLGITIRDENGNEVLRTK
ncbi:MAG: hypothetical protein HF976_01830 [ANME-2 cluster archaeon]|nr:hypothetical protein [ANME-2 cluster archaeon]MBC2700148.1 hypothetical protein [ANME-2 cluster archaeon]MBC2708754.1 hypothetical protein [ANME-2 cluster archaeon]MBC2748287.1 hypothetical protein [ANME-2 cluster archaeon]